VRANAAGHFDVTGPPVFCGGYPLPDNSCPDGLFGEWAWNGQYLQARVDPLGMFPLYYGELPGGIAISTSVQGVLGAGVSRELDFAALQVLCELGFNVGCDTAFRAVKAFPIGGRLQWERGRLKVTETLPVITPNPLTRGKAIDAYLDLFHDAVQRRIIAGAPIRLPLSGGRDSRHILLELVACGARPERCYTSAFLTMRNDVTVAQSLCRKLDLPHSESAVPKDLITTEIAKNNCISYEALEHNWVWPLAHNMAHSEAVSYDGIDGDVLSAGHFHDDENSRLYRHDKFDELAQRLAPNPTLRLAPRGVGVARADAYQRLVDELRRYRGTHNPMMLFHLYNRSRRAVSITITNLYGGVMRTVFAPFLDRGVFNFLAGLPEEMFSDKTFHTQAISRKFPDIDHIGYAKKTPVPGPVCLRYARQGFRFALTAPVSPLLDRPRLTARFAKAMLSPTYQKEAPSIFHTAVLLNQVGRLAEGNFEASYC
jgi:asparagine synthase (glutamine-hydrolysing)